MTSGGFALNDPNQRPAHPTWRLLITIRRNIMTLNAIHPGEHLAEELKELGMNAAELAWQLDVPTNRVTEILNGRRAITGDTALRLAHFWIPGQWVK
jgi:addiction module HigA family antidote